MGAYLSEPVTEKISEDNENGIVKYGASSMQGWRTSQEDAHICLLDFDEGTSLFGVFDGHGGAEVARYCARHLPGFLKNIPHYKEGNIKAALEEAFIEFDELLTKEEVIAELKVLAGDDYIRSDEDEADGNEASLLKEEANLPLEALIARYSGHENDPNEVVKRDHLPPHIRQEISAKKTKLVSPFLRSKQGPSTSTAHPDDSKSNRSIICSSSSSTSNESEAFNSFEPCSSSSSSGVSSKGSSSLSLPNGNISDSYSSQQADTFNTPASTTTSSAVAPSTATAIANQPPDGGDPVSSSVNEVTEDKNDICKVSSTIKLETSKPELNLFNNEANEVVSGDLSNSSSVSDNESNKQSNGETSTQNEKDSCVSTSSEAAPAKPSSKSSRSLTSTSLTTSSSSPSPSTSSAACVNDSTITAAASTSADEPTSSSKGKGKKKKIIVPEEKVKSDSTTRSGRIDYKAILSEELPKEGDEFDESSDSSDMEYGAEDDAEEDDDDDDDDEDDDDDDDDEDDEDVHNVFTASSTDFEVPGRDSGCTAVVAVLRGNQLYVANAGDSRCVLSRRGKAHDMSIDHKPEDLAEKKRIKAAGGTITSDGRINGGLNLSRAIGDHAYKTNTELSLKDQMITAFPDIRHALIRPGRDEFMVLACDGIWNSMTSQEVVDFIRERLDDKKSLSSVCEELFDYCLSPNTEGDGTGCDNMTCVIVKFIDVKPLSHQLDFQDSDEEEIFKSKEEQMVPSQSEPKKSKTEEQEASGSQQREAIEPATKKLKTEN